MFCVAFQVLHASPSTDLAATGTIHPHPTRHDACKDGILFYYLTVLGLVQPNIVLPDVVHARYLYHACMIIYITSGTIHKLVKIHTLSSCLRAGITPVIIHFSPFRQLEKRYWRFGQQAPRVVSGMTVNAPLLHNSVCTRWEVILMLGSL